jgi:hypothetical protein
MCEAEAKVGCDVCQVADATFFCCLSNHLLVCCHASVNLVSLPDVPLLVDIQSRCFGCFLSEAFLERHVPILVPILLVGLGMLVSSNVVTEISCHGYQAVEKGRQFWCQGVRVYGLGPNTFELAFLACCILPEVASAHCCD